MKERPEVDKKERQIAPQRISVYVCSTGWGKKGLVYVGEHRSVVFSFFSMKSTHTSAHRNHRQPQVQAERESACGERERESEKNYFRKSRPTEEQSSRGK